MLRLWGSLGLALVISSGTLPAVAAEPGPDWTLIDSQTVRFFVPDPEAPSPRPGGGPAQADPASDPEWLLVATEHVKYFLADGGEVEEQVLDRTAESRTAFAGRTHEADGTRVARRGAIYEGPRQTWTRESLVTAPQGRYMITTGTYKIPRFRDVEAPWVEVDHYKRQARTITRVAITTRSRILTSSGGEVIPGDAGTTRIETRTTEWTDQGGIDPSLDKVAGRGYEKPVPELVDHVTRSVEEARRPLVGDSRTSAKDLSNLGQPGFSTGPTRGAARQGGQDARIARELAGSSRARSAGGGTFESPFASLGSEFWGRSGSRTLFRFRLTAQGDLKVLAIFPVDEQGRVVEAAGATWALDSRGALPTQTVSTTGLSATMTDAHRTGSGIRVNGSFRNKLTGGSAASLELSAQ